MSKKQVSQSDLRAMMQKMKSDKQSAANNPKLKKYKLSSREIALIEEEKKRKAEEQSEERKKFAKKAGVPENFFDSAKTKAFLNLNKAPQKSILKNRGAAPPPGASSTLPGANSKATGKEWISSAPVVSTKKSSGFKTPSGGSIKHLQEEEGLPSDFFDNKAGSSSRGPEDNKKEDQQQLAEDSTSLPEGFFDDPIQDAKARGIEYKDPAEEEWEAFKKEISAEVAAADEAQAEGELQDTEERQLEEIEDQMQAWSRVRDAEIKKDQVDERLKTVKSAKKDDGAADDSDDEADLQEMDEFLDWRLKKS